MDIGAPSGRLIGGRCISVHVISSFILFSICASYCTLSRAEAHSGSGELLGKADGVVMDIGAPSGRAIGGRCISVHFMAVSLQNPCTYQFSITDSGYYRFL